MTAGVDFARALWIRRAQDLRVRDSGAYLRGIEQATVSLVEETETDDLIRVVYELRNSAPHAQIVEDGHGAFHLPSRINWSGPRVKRSRDGTPYIHVPFEHAAFQSPSQRRDSGMTIATLKRMLPEDVYRKAVKLVATMPKREGPIYRQLYRGPAGRQFVAADRYTRGGHLHDKTPGPRFTVGPDGVAVETWRGERTVQGRDRNGRRLTNPAWQTSRFDRLFKSGPKGHSKYLTIRTITPNSRGWNIPAQTGLGIARQVQGALSSGVGSGRFRELLRRAALAAL
jgi:hypothetical protein